MHIIITPTRVISIAGNVGEYLNQRQMLKNITEIVMRSSHPIGKNADIIEKEAVTKEITVCLNTQNQGNVEMGLDVDTGYRVDVSLGINPQPMFLLVR